MSMYGKYPKVKINGKEVEQNGLDGAPKAWPTTDCSKDKIITVQSLKDEVDINKIIKKMEKGMIPEFSEGMYMDVSEFGDLADSIIQVQKANDMFMSLPAEVRERFSNDPVNLVNFLDDASNRKEAEELGLVARKEPETPASIPPETGGAH